MKEAMLDVSFKVFNWEVLYSIKLLVSKYLINHKIVDLFPENG